MAESIPNAGGGGGGGSAGATGGDGTPSIGPKSVRPWVSGGGTPERKGKRWWGILKACLALVIAVGVGVGVFFGMREVRWYSQRQTEQRVLQNLIHKKIDLRIDFSPRPTTLHPDLVNNILSEALKFSRQTTQMVDVSGGLTGTRNKTVLVPNYYRLSNPLDDRVLAEIAKIYTDHPGEFNNGWVKQIKSVRRVEVPVAGQKIADGSRIRILIEAEFRQPTAFVEQGGNYYLVDHDGVLLPGVYSAADRRGVVGLITIRNARGALPARVGEVWNLDQAAKRCGGDAAAGIELAELLSGKNFTTQISAINLENMDGRSDALGPWIKLETIFPQVNDPNRLTEIHWGRPVGEEKVVEIKATAKVKALQGLYTQFGRIDAGRPYVDIRLDQIQIPMMAESTPPATASPSELGH